MSKFRFSARPRAAAVFVLFAWIAGAAPGAAPETFLGAIDKITVLDQALEMRTPTDLVRVSRAGDGLLRIRVTDKGSFSEEPSFAVRPGLVQTAPEFREEDGKMVVEAGRLRLEIDRDRGLMDVFDGATVILAEPEDGGVFFRDHAPGCRKVMPPDEHYYGLGEKTGGLDKRGGRLVMYNTEGAWAAGSDPLYQSQPFLLALRQGRSYGLFFDNPGRSVFDLGRTRPDRFTFSASSGELDYWVVAGPTPKEVLTRYGQLVGTLPLPPLWGLGYHHARMNLKSAEEARRLRDDFAAHDFPLDAIHLDLPYMEDYKAFTFDRERFPFPAKLIADLAGSGVHTVVVVEPVIKVDTNYTPYIQALGDGFLVKNPDGRPFTARSWPGEVTFPDFLQPAARTWWGGRHRFFTDLGVAGVWINGSEPAGWIYDVRLAGNMVYQRAGVPWERMRQGAEGDVPHETVHNLYGLLDARATREGLEAAEPGTRPFLLSRAGYAGLARTAGVITGDNGSTWYHLAESLPMQLGLGLSGLALVGSNVGGYDGSPSAELFARWMEAAVFYPLCRNHTGLNMPDQEPWVFGDEVTQISREAMGLRYRLLPYTYSLVEESTRTNWPLMRAMVLEFPDDPAVTNLSDQFMWGPSILAAPVVEKGRTRRSVYLPAGTWYDFYTGERREGPARISVAAPLAKLPVFARAGAIIPLAPAMRHTGEKPWDPLTLLVFAGTGESSFTLYEDDGITMDYRQGRWSRRLLSSRPAPGGVEIRIGEREGSFTPSRKKFELKVFGAPASGKVKLLHESGDCTPCTSATYIRESGYWLIEVPDDGKARTIVIAQ